MTKKAMNIPGPDHPVTVEHNPKRVIVTLGGRVIADTTKALTQRGTSDPPFQYIPRRDVDMDALSRSEATSSCPYKGNATYFSIPVGGSRSADAIWTYEAPYDVVAGVREHVAFYPDRVDSIEERDCRYGRCSLPCRHSNQTHERLRSWHINGGHLRTGWLFRRKQSRNWVAINRPSG